MSQPIPTPIPATPAPPAPEVKDKLDALGVVGIVIGAICVLLLMGAAIIMMKSPAKARSGGNVNEDFGHDFHELRA